MVSSRCVVCETAEDNLGTVCETAENGLLNMWDSRQRSPSVRRQRDGLRGWAQGTVFDLCLLSLRMFQS